MGAGGLGTPSPPSGPVQNPEPDAPPAEPPAPTPPPAEPPAPTPPAAEPPAPEPESGGAVQAGASGAKKNLAFQKTMMGPVGGMNEFLKDQGHTPEPPGDAATDVDESTSPPSSVSQPAGGFGPPAQSPSGFGAPAASSSGFGAPVQGATSQAGFAPPSETGPFDAGDIPEGPPSGSFGGGGGGGKSNKTKYLIMGGVGCLVFLLLACVIGGWIAYSAMKEAVEEAQMEIDETGGLAGVQGELARLDLSATLSTLQMICDMDRSAEGARGSFHPEVFEDLRDDACTVNRSTVTAFSDTSNSQISEGSSGLTGTSDCFMFSSGGASITTCKYEGDTVITAMQGIDQVR